jgi:hypothetical protein
MMVGNEQRAEEEEGGSGHILTLLLHVSWLGSGQRGLGSTVEMPTSMATGLR